MAQFFHVDRTRSLQAGLVLDLQRRNSLHPPELEALVADLFPGGMTGHGWQYLWNNATGASDTMTEAFFEYVRRAEFPDRPSRYQSIFAFGTLEDAKTFRMRYPGSGGVQGTIFAVEATEAFKCNMPLVDMGISVLVGIDSARAYWRGERGHAEELWEYLLRPPVTLLRAVE